MQYSGKHITISLSRNGLIFELQFEFRGKVRNFEFTVFGCSFDTEETELERHLNEPTLADELGP